MDTRVEPFQLDIGGDALAGTLLSPAPRLPGVLFVHGWGGNQRHDLVRAREIAGLGCVCMTFDLRGHEGTFSMQETVNRQQNMHDLLSAYDRLATSANVDPHSIAVVGISYGGYLAALLTAQRPVRWLALRSAALYPDEGWELPKRELHRRYDLAAYRRRRHGPEDNSALRACEAFAGDALVVAAERDTIVPRPVTQSYASAFVASARSLTMRVLPDADHALTDKACQQAYTTLLVDWMTEMIMGSRQSHARERLQEHQDMVSESA